MISNDIQQVTGTITGTGTTNEAVKGNGKVDIVERERANNSIEAEFERKRQDAIRSLGFDW